MKRLLLILLAALAVSGCGTTSGGSSTVTETSPASTVTKTKTVTDKSQVAACQQAIRDVLHADGQLLSATSLYEKQITPAYKAGLLGGSVSIVVSKIHTANTHVHSATALLHKANPFAKVCFNK